MLIFQFSAFFYTRRILFDIDYMTARQQKIPQKLYFRIYPTFIEASKEQLKLVNRNSYYHISVWQGETMLGEMLEGASPAILAEKIFLTKALISFSQPFERKQFAIKLVEHYEEDRLLGVGMFELQGVKEKFIERSQRFHSLQSALLITPNGTMKLVFSIFVESDRNQLNQYIKKFKENQRNVLRARRNINNYKKEMLHRSTEREKENSKTKRKNPKDLSDIKETKDQSKIEKEEVYTNQYPNDENEIKVSFLRKERPRQHDDISFGSAPPGTYLQIDSAAKFHSKKFEKNINKLKKTLNEAEEKEFQAYSNIMEEYRANSHFASIMDAGSASLISDGSQESEMRFHEENETYSEKAIKKFKSNVSRCFNLTFIIIAIALIYFVIAPSKRFTKSEKKLKKPKQAGQEHL